MSTPIAKTRELTGEEWGIFELLNCGESSQPLYDNVRRPGTKLASVVKIYTFGEGWQTAYLNPEEREAEYQRRGIKTTKAKNAEHRDKWIVARTNELMRVYGPKVKTYKMQGVKSEIEKILCNPNSDKYSDLSRDGNKTQDVFNQIVSSFLS